MSTDLRPHVMPVRRLGYVVVIGILAMEAGVSIERMLETDAAPEHVRAHAGSASGACSIGEAVIGLRSDGAVVCTRTDFSISTGTGVTMTGPTRVRTGIAGLTRAPASPSPSLVGCGTDASIVGDDLAGYVTTGVDAVVCKILFFGWRDRACAVSSPGPAPVSAYTVSADMLSLSSVAPSTRYYYVCD